MRTRTGSRWMGRGVMVAVVFGLVSCSAVNPTEITQPSDSGVTSPAPTEPAPTSPAPTDPAPAIPAVVSADEGVCGYISTATIEKLLGEPIESTRLDKTIREPACYYASSTSSAYLAPRCIDVEEYLPKLLDGSTALQGSAPGARARSLGRHVFAVTENGKCVLDLGVLWKNPPSDNGQAALAAALLEAYNAAKDH